MKQDKNHFLVILAIYFLIFLTIAISPYVIVSGEENSLSHILFFESLMTTNLIVPFALNTIYLVYLLLAPLLQMGGNHSLIYYV